MLNKSILCGRLTSDLELKTTPNGKTVTSVTLAVERDFSNNGEKETDFIPVVIWGSTAEFAARNFSKGKMMIVSGRIQIRRYTTQNNENRYATEVVAENVYFAGNKPSESNSSAPKQGAGYDANNAPAPYSAETVAFTEMTSDDSLPF